MNRKVIYARFHEVLYAPLAGTLDKSLPVPGKTLNNLDMTTTDQGLSVTFTHNGVKLDLLVPYPNIVLMSLAPEDKSLKVVKGA